MNKFTVFSVIAVVLLVVPAAAQQDQRVEIKPGMIKADSPLHNMEIAFDNFMVNVGATDPSEVAFERASELRDMQQRGKDTPNRINRVRTDMEHHANVSVQSVGGQEVRVEGGNMYVDDGQQTVRMQDGNIHVDGPDGTIDVSPGSIDVQESDGSISIKNGNIRVQGKDGSVRVNAGKVKETASTRGENLQKARVVLQDVQKDAPEEAQPGLQNALSQMQQHEQRMEQLRQQITQQMETVRQRMQEARQQAQQQQQQARQDAEQAMQDAEQQQQDAMDQAQDELDNRP